MKLDTGEIGEDQFQAWCSQGGLTVTPARRDKYGWDFFVQFPQLDTSSEVGGRLPQLICMVQVKSTAVGECEAPIKLDNWERMINKPIPWFVAAVSLKKSRPHGLFLVHIDEKWTLQVLKRFREEKKANPKFAATMHKKSINITWNEQNKVSPLTGESLREAMISHIGKDQMKYAMQKEDWYKSSGYEKEHKRISMAIRGTNSAEVYSKMRDFALGIVANLPFDLLTVSDQRFGIPIEEINLTEASAEEKQGHMGPQSPDAYEMTELVLSDEERTSIIHLQCKTYASHWVFPDLPDDYRRYRFIAPGIEILLDEPKRKNQQRKTFPLFLNLAFSFPVLANLSTAISLAALAAIGRTIQLMASAGYKGFRIEVVRDEAWRALPVCRDPLGVSAELVSISKVFEQVAMLATDFGVSAEEVVRPDILIEHASRILLINTGISGQDDIEISVPTNAAGPEQINGKSAAILLAASMPIGRLRLVISFIIWGTAEYIAPEGGNPAQLNIPHGAVCVLWKQVIPNTYWSMSSFIEELEQAFASIKEHGFEIVIPPSNNALANFVE